MSLDIENEFDDVVGALRGTPQAEAPASLAAAARERAANDVPPTPPFGAFEEHADTLFTYTSALLDGDTWLAEHVLVEAFARSKGKAEPSLAEVIQAARHAGLEALAKSGPLRAEGALSIADRALVYERRLGLSMQELARGWSQLPARLTERLTACGAQLFAALEQATNRAPACSEWRERLPQALLGVLAEEQAEAYAKHLTECPACAGWTDLLETSMTPTPKTLPASQKTRDRLKEEVEPGHMPTPEELGIQVAVSCCYCHDRMRRKEAAFCSTCLAPHHSDCFEEYGSCATPGCVGTDMIFPSVGRPKQPSGWSQRLTTGAVVLALSAFGAAAFTAVESRNRELGSGALVTTMAEVAPKAPPAGVVVEAAPRPAVADEVLAHEPVSLLQDPIRFEVAPGEIGVAELIQRWGAAHNLNVTIDIHKRDPKAEDPKVTIAKPRSFDRTQFRALLESLDVVLVMGEGDTAQAVSRRNLSLKVGDPILVEGDTPVDPDRFISRVIKIRHGGGNSIFATTRGLLSRDSNRIGNILYSQGPELITIVDLARKVRAYEEMIVKLDVPQAPGPKARVEVFSVDSATWLNLRGARPQDVVKGLERGAQQSSEAVKLVESADLNYPAGLPKNANVTVFRRSVELSAVHAEELELRARPLNEIKRPDGVVSGDVIGLTFEAMGKGQLHAQLPLEDVSVQAISVSGETGKRFLVMVVTNQN